MNQTTSHKVSPRDVFLHLLTTIALYVSAGSFIALLFQYVNILHPDILEFNQYARESAVGIIRWSIASLIVVFPVYVAATWVLNKAYVREPERRNIWIRKWLTYLTLFVAASIIIGDLVTLIYNLLSGGLTTQFLLKVLIVLFVAGVAFYYYLWDLRRHNID